MRAVVWLRAQRVGFNGQERTAAAFGAFKGICGSTNLHTMSTGGADIASSHLQRIGVFQKLA